MATLESIITKPQSSSAAAATGEKVVEKRSPSSSFSSETSSVPNPSPRSPSSSLVPAGWHDSVRVLAPADGRAAGQALALSFAADAFAQCLVTDPDAHSRQTAAARWQLHVNLMAYTATAVARAGLVTAVGADCESVALWLPPGASVDGWWMGLRSGLWRLRWQLPAACRRRYFGELLPLLHDTKEEVMAARAGCSPDGTRAPDNSYYLLYLGTKPAARGRGLAKALLRHMMARADREGCPIYLESSSPANTAYYRKFGFVRQKDIILCRGMPDSVTLSIMVREPQVL